MYFYNSLKFYFLSFLTLIFQFLFLATIKEFEYEFNIYIQIMAINSILLSFVGSIQFYFKKKNNLVSLSFLKKTIIILNLIIILVAVYYYFLNIKWFIFFFSSIISLFFFTINIAYNTRFNLFDRNTNLLLNFSLVKFIFIYLAYLNNFDILNTLILSNLIIVTLCLNVIKKIKIILSEKNSFSLKSIFNNILGTGNTTLDKLYCTNYAVLISVNYFLIFKVASIFQYFTEVLYRKERFLITEGKSRIDKKLIMIKFFTVFFLIAFCNLIIQKFNYVIDNLNNGNLEFIFSFFQILVKYNLEFSLIALAFLINSVAGLTYDKIYRKFGNNYLIYINFLNVLFFVILLFLFGNSIFNMAIIFLAIHILNYFFIKLLDIYLIKKTSQN